MAKAVGTEIKRGSMVGVKYTEKEGKLQYCLLWNVPDVAS